MLGLTYKIEGEVMDKKVNDILAKHQRSDEVSSELNPLLDGRIKIILKNAHSRLRRKYKGVPLWSFISEMTGRGSTYSMKICKEFGWDAYRDASKPI